MTENLKNFLWGFKPTSKIILNSFELVIDILNLEKVKGWPLCVDSSDKCE